MGSGGFFLPVCSTRSMVGGWWVDGGWMVGGWWVDDGWMVGGWWVVNRLYAWLVGE